MYAIIQSGGKQYKVAAGEKVKLEKLGQEAGVDVDLPALLVVDGDQVWTAGQKGGYKVSGKVLADGKRRKVLVFHKKRRKQYKKLRGHRQPFTAVRITEIAFDGQSFKAPEQAAVSAKGPKATEGGAAPEGAVAPKKKASAKKHASGEAGGGTKSARHGGSSKTSKSKGGAAPKKK